MSLYRTSSTSAKLSLCAALSLAFAVFTTSQSFAVDSTGGYGLRGVGAQSCQRYLDILEIQDPVQLRPFISWMDGYISGVNQLQTATYDASPVVSSNAMASMLRNLCSTKPEMKFETSLAQLLNALKPYRVQKNSRLVEVSVDDNFAAVRQETLVWMQSEMASMGLYTGEADGIFGASTQSALANFQSSNGLNPTAVPDADTVIKFIELATKRLQSRQGQ